MHPREPLFAVRHAAARFVLCVAAFLAALLAALPALAAGTAEVRLVSPDTYADAGWHSFDRARNLQRLRAHLEALAARLPDGQRLSVEILDVDLAGEERPGRMNGVRVLRGGADWPRMRLRWQLSGTGISPRGADEWLSDPSYLTRLPPPPASAEALPYETRMLDEWFQERILQGLSAR